VKPAKLQAVLEDLSVLERTERIEYLIALGEEYRNFSTEEVPRDATCRVPGCESEVYLGVSPLGEGLRFKFAVDNPQGISAMALATILDNSLSGEPLSHVSEISEDLIYDIFGRDLSMGKSMGLSGMVRMARDSARYGKPLAS